MKMLDVYRIPNQRTQQLIDKALKSGDLLPDGRNGFISTKDPQFDNPIIPKSFRIKSVYFWAAWAGVIGTIIGLIQLYLYFHSGR